MANVSEKHIYFWKRISFRILVGALIPLAVSSYVIYSVMASFTEMSELRERLQGVWSTVRVAETECILNLTRMRVAIEAAWSADNTKPSAYVNYFEVNLAKIQKLADDQGEADSKKIYDAATEQIKRIAIDVDLFGEVVKRGDRVEGERLKQQISQQLTELEKAIERLKARHELKELNDLSVITEKEQRFLNRLYFIIAAVAIFGFALAVIVTISITHPVSLLVKRLQDIATGEGDLTKRIETSFTTGEMKEAAAWMNLFLDKTHSIIRTIANASKTVRRTTEQVSVYSNSTNVLAVSINKTMMTQSTNIDDCSSSLNKIDDLLQASGDSSRQAASLSKIAMDRALQGGASVNETIEAMEKIEESADKVEVLVSSINDIAAQTNLLAINAAIEASKAGEHGRGFAVVAEEVRKLAERTRKLTGQVTVLITESNSRVKTGVSLAKNAGIALDGIIKDVEAVSSLIQRIAASATKQTESSTQLVSGMQKVTEGIQENLREMNQVSQTVAMTSVEVHRLDELVNELNNIVGQFRLEEATSAPIASVVPISSGEQTAIMEIPQIPEFAEVAHDSENNERDVA